MPEATSYCDFRCGNLRLGSMGGYVCHKHKRKVEIGKNGLPIKLLRCQTEGQTGCHSVQDADSALAPDAMPSMRS